MFSYLQAPQKNAIRGKLLECLPSEQDHSVRNKVGDAVAEIARQYAAEGGTHSVTEIFRSRQLTIPSQTRYGQNC